MFEKVENLEILKLVLTLVGTIASLVFGIIGIATETHIDIEETVDNRVIKKREATKWFKIVLSGLVISSLVSGSSLFVDNEVNKLNSEAEENYRKREDRNFDKVLTRTEEIAHPLYPLHIEATISVGLKLDPPDIDAFYDYYNYFKKKRTTISKPEDFDLALIDAGLLTYGEVKPFDPRDEKKYDKKLMRFNTYLLYKACPQFYFYLYRGDSTTSIDKTTADFYFGAGSMNLTNQYKMTYQVDFLTRTIKFTYSFDDPNRTNAKKVPSLYSCKNGFVAIKLLYSDPNSTELDFLKIFSGNNRDSYIPIFSENDLDVARKIDLGGYVNAKCYVKKLF